MKKIIFILISGLLFSQKQYEVDWEIVAKIREEGFQRSEICQYFILYDRCARSPSN